jgi:hypothetical protein
VPEGSPSFYGKKTQGDKQNSEECLHFCAKGAHFSLPVFCSVT